MAEEASDRLKLDQAFEDGSALLSKLIGSGVSMIAPEGALVGSAVEWISEKLLRTVGTAVVSMVGRGAAARAGAAALVIEADAAERANKQEAPRNDGFAESRDGQRPDSEELLEGVLIYAAQSYEQRKVVLLAHLYDGVAFDESVGASEGHFLLKLADRLTYQQLVLLSLFEDEQHFDALADASVKRDVGETRPSEAVALEIDDLADQGPLGVQVEGGDEIARPGELWGSSGRASAQPFQRLKLTAVGIRMHRLMRLSTIAAEDQAEALGELTTPARSEAS